MLHEVFYWVFNMSIIASMSGAIVMLVRLVKKIPRRITVFLWLIPFLRMVLPFGLSSQYSFVLLLSKLINKEIIKTITVYQPVITRSNLTTMNLTQVAETYFPITYKVNILEDVFRTAAVIWIIVVIAIFIIMAATYLVTMYEIKGATHARDNIYFSEKISSPAVYGIIKPKIILPVSYKDKEIDLVILHEKMHIRSKDNLWRMIASLVTAVHWFNPFCWIFLRSFLADLELTCDERVVAKLGSDRTKEYVSVLLESSRAKFVFASSFGGAKIRKRIENIISFEKMTWFSLVIFIALIGVIYYVLMTNG